VSLVVEIKAVADELVDFDFRRTVEAPLVGWAVAAVSAFAPIAAFATLAAISSGARSSAGTVLSRRAILSVRLL
jgi:hypothetical protein